MTRAVPHGAHAAQGLGRTAAVPAPGQVITFRTGGMALIPKCDYGTGSSERLVAVDVSIALK